MVPSMTKEIHAAIRELLTEQPNSFRRDVIDLVALKVKCHPATVRHALQLVVDSRNVIVTGRIRSATLKWSDVQFTSGQAHDAIIDRNIDDRNVIRTKATGKLIDAPRYIGGIEWGMAHCLGFNPVIPMAPLSLDFWVRR